MKTSSKRIKGAPGDEDTSRIKRIHGMVVFLVVVTSVSIILVVWQIWRANLLAAM